MLWSGPRSLKYFVVLPQAVVTGAPLVPILVVGAFKMVRILVNLHSKLPVLGFQMNYLENPRGNSENIPRLPTLMWHGKTSS
jgi:hypothetical protein